MATEKNNPGEIRIIRLYDAPIEAVWDAWTDPAQVAQWWGPRGFTLTTHSKDLRVGGSWRYTMHGPDGTDYPNVTRYLEVVEHAKLVYDHGGTDETPPLFRVTVLFSETYGKTRMEMCMRLPSPEQAQRMRQFIKEAGGNATWDRLAEYLDQEIRGKDSFIINRSFDAPLEQMYEMCTAPQHLAHWLTPAGLSMQMIRAEIRTGGSAFYFMADGAGQKFYERIEYFEMKRPHRIVYIQQCCDENETVSRHPRLPAWPQTVQTTVTLSEEAPGATRVTIAQEPHGTFTHAELKAFVAEKGAMTRAWNASFDKLDAHLASHSL